MSKTMVREIVLPETKPESEWLRGRAAKKVSPKRTHAVLQRWFALRLEEWGGERGIVGTEWRFRVAPPGEDIRPLVPDISYLAYDRIGDATEEELETPLIPPTVAIEIRSPGDNRRDVEDKVSCPDTRGDRCGDRREPEDPYRHCAGCVVPPYLLG